MDEQKATLATEQLVSVIVPVYNAETYLRDALESLRGQSHASFEAIIVDDGSTDGSATIGREFCQSDNRFRLIRQDNRGVSAARDIGIEAARGQWIAFLDADDLFYPESLKLMLAAAEETGAAIVAAAYSKGFSMPRPSGGARVTTLNADEAIAIGLYQKKILNNPWGMLFNASVFKGDGAPRFRAGRYEDLDLFYRAFERVETVAVLERTVYYYRDNPVSFINTWSDERLDALDVTDRMVEHFRDRLSRSPGQISERLLEAALDRRFSAHYNILLLMSRYGIDLPKQRARCLKIIRERRFRELTNPSVRLKNKLGAILSYGGMPMIHLIARFQR